MGQIIVTENIRVLERDSVEANHKFSNVLYIKHFVKDWSYGNKYSKQMSKIPCVVCGEEILFGPDPRKCLKAC